MESLEPIRSSVLDVLLEALESWADEMAQKERTAGYAAQMRKQAVVAATHVGREWAFLLTAIHIRDLRRELASPSIRCLPDDVDESAGLREVTDPRD